MTLPPPKVCELIRKLHALLGSPSDKEALSARKKLSRLLAKHELSWNDAGYPRGHQRQHFKSQCRTVRRTSRSTEVHPRFGSTLDRGAYRDHG